MKHAIQDIRDAHALEHAKMSRDAARDHFPSRRAGAGARFLPRAGATFATNALGTANLLEAVRVANLPCTIVVVTTDKCYENDGRPRSFQGERSARRARSLQREQGGGGNRRGVVSRFVFSHGTEVALASARAGNVIGGGDWAEDRIVPDCIRALSAGKPIPVRNPDFTRPWQHVLEPLGGYLLLGAKLEEARAEKSAEEIARYAQAFNFGPEPDANRSVRDLVEEVLRHWPGTWEQIAQEKHLKEAPLLSLAIDKARKRSAGNRAGISPRPSRRPSRGIAISRAASAAGAFLRFWGFLSLSPA
jgi:CDP-glucose 4,6-dehydratase